MSRIRTVEEALIAEYHPADQMRCPIHFCVGQEAAPAALGLCLKTDDAIFTHYRSHGYYLAKGGDLNGMVAEFYGKSTGINGGVAGSMELNDPSIHVHSGAIVGGLAGLAVGNAFAQKYKGTKDITVAVFGDGAMDEGATYEAINLAVLYQLPVLFICENNGFAAHTSIAKRTKADILDRALSFGIDGVSCGDHDPMLLLDVISLAVKAIRKNGAPYFIEIGTERFCGHVGAGDDMEHCYRSQSSVDYSIEFDPLTRLRGTIDPTLVITGGLDQAREIHDAIDLAKAAPWPTVPPDTMSNTYASCVKFTEQAGSFSGGQQEAKLVAF